VFIAEDARGPRSLYLSSKKKARRWATWGVLRGKFDGAAAELEGGQSWSRNGTSRPRKFLQTQRQRPRCDFGPPSTHSRI